MPTTVGQPKDCAMASKPEAVLKTGVAVGSIKIEPVW